MIPSEFYANPQRHPRWAAQCALEEEMLSLGSEKIQERINKARERGDMGTLRTHRHLVLEWIEPVAAKIEEWKAVQAKSRGATSIAKRLVNKVDPKVAAVCALRVIVKTLSQNNRAIINIASEIGTWIEHEAQAAAWRRVYPEDWAKLAKKYAEGGSNASHQKRSRVNIFNKHVKDDIGWNSWSTAEKQRVGLVMLECVIKGTGRFAIGPDPAFKKARGSGARSRPIVLLTDPELLAVLQEAEDNELVVWPQYLPCVIPPRPWVNAKDGGYWTPFVRNPFLIRFKAMHEDQKRRAIDEYNALDMGNVLDAVNALQETAWKVNAKVLQVAQAIWDEDLGIKSMPKREDEKPLERDPETRAEHEMAWDLWARMSDEEKEANRGMIKPALTWVRAAAAIHKRNAKRASKYLAGLETMKAAKRMTREPYFFFPYMLDFRGRVYPIPSTLSPQGNDLHKGLLTFATGKKIPDDSAFWLAMHVANCHGVDKVSLEKRVAWTYEREELWRRIASDPLEHREWLQADGGDQAWQALAAILEWVAYLDDPENFESSLPIRVDGSCNGIQHLAAMARDAVSGRAVNLTPGDEPRDIYGEVAARLTAMLEDLAMAGDTMAHHWLTIVGGKVPRSLTKRPVMILPYGGTRHAYFEYTMEWLDDLDPDEKLVPADDRYATVGYIVRLLWKAVDGHLGATQKVMKWLQDCCAIASATGKVLTWMTPSGFYCRQFYGEMVSTQVNTLIDGQRYQLRTNEVSKVMDLDAQGAAIAPNFVHSQDASCLVLAVKKAYHWEIDHLTTIHDSYGTVAADMDKLYACIREAFIENYETDVLGDFLKWCQHINPKAKSWPDRPEEGDLDIEEVRHSDYFFA